MAVEGRTPEPAQPAGFRAFWARYSPLFVPILAVITALIVGAVIIGITGGDWLAAYIGLWQGAFGSPRALANTVIRGTPYIICGLAVALAFKSGLFNIGAEGQLYAGAMCAVVIGTTLRLPPLLHIPMGIVAGAVGGA
ncbi:MAG: ABC transporter permease, partial [Chloroflexia bacterium]|nr:ABC transporter permease [Chloroflexia bacterium]